MRRTVKLMIMFIVLALAGCGKKSWLHDRSEDYEKAPTCSTIKIPKDFKPESFGDEYSIPK